MEQTNQNQPNVELATAYTAAWAEMQHVAKNATNPHFKSDYATLDAVIDSVRTVFAKYGLSVLQMPGKIVELEGGGLGISVASVIIHKSGSMLNAETQVPLAQKTPQAAGGAITYARRYALAAIAGIAQVDDDGNAASAAADDDEPDTAELEESILACETEDELEELKEEVQETGDKTLVNLFMKQRKTIKKAKKAAA